jgi:arsenical pump membrane protein
VHLFVQSLSQSWQPFVLITGLLFIGHVASREGLFESVGQLVARTPGSDVALFALTMVAVAIVTALLNLDTSVVFMTPVALHAAKARNADDTAFLYGTILMSNAASLLLVGSNLTNMLVFASRPVRGVSFAEHMALAWVSSVLITIALVALWRRRQLQHRAVASAQRAHWRLGPGTVAAVAAVALMLVLSQPALPVFVLGALLEVADLVVRRRVRMRDLVRVASPQVVGPLFVVAVLVGWLGRSWHQIGHLVAHANSLTTAALAGGVSLVINNLPAASLFAGQPIAHPYALLLGLNLGPNAFVTGAMSTMLWFRLVRREGFAPTISQFVRIGSPVALVTLCVASLLV